jgi:mono/diheme cytochrome c family protein
VAKSVEMLVKVGSFLAKLPLHLALLTGLICLSGCEDEYSNTMRYPLRTDPLVLSDKLGPERPTPDVPGKLPVFSSEDLLEYPNPFYQSAADRDREDLFRSSKLRDPNLLSAADRKELQDVLDELFGTPAAPKVEGVSEDVLHSKDLDLSPANLKLGSHYYRIHCLHCHGLTGNGRGPTARWINPHPRDYRQGLFKFQSVDQSDGQTRKPSRDDLIRTLREGIEGTAMPSFGLLSERDIEALASYVIHLAIRGEAEYLTLQNGFRYDEKTNSLQPDEERSPSEYVRLIVHKLGDDWLKSQSKPIKIASYPVQDAELKASVLRGQALFLADEAKLKQMFPKHDINKLKGASCVTCHKDFGRQASFKFDVWGTMVRPADLTRAVYRGGHRPVDFYRRVHSGINGSGMVGFGGTLTSDQIWDVVNFVRILPYERMRKELGIEID